VRADSHDLVNKILNADDVVLAQALIEQKLKIIT
jgi:hypothetical protein